MSQAPIPAAPYKELDPFEEADAPFFFGRERDREVIAANLLASRLTVLYGPSGVGKSSVLRAGVSHALRRRARQNLLEYGTPEFAVVVFNAWRDDPVAGLIAAVHDSVAHALGDTFAPPPPGELIPTLQAYASLVGGDLLIILDQFEDYFLYHPREDGAGTFAAEFPRAVRLRDLPANFLVALRDDALAKLDRFKRDIPSLFDNLLPVRHLDHAAAREAIVRPIAQYNRLRAAESPPFSVEEALVTAVIEGVETSPVAGGESGSGVGSPAGLASAEKHIETPYLQLVMTRLWEAERRAGSHVLRRATLDELGGAQRIARTHVDSAIAALPQDAQATVADVVQYLVTPSRAKIAHALPDLAYYTKRAEEQIAPVLERLAGGNVRILRPVPPPPGQPEIRRYEIFHDVLAQAILDWRRSYLTRQAQEAARREEQQRAEHEKERIRQEEQQRAQQARVGYLRRSRGALALLAVVASVLAVILWVQFLTAQNQRATAEAAQAGAEAAQARAQDERATAQVATENAESRRLAAEAIGLLTSDPELAVLLAREAVRIKPTEQAQYALRQALLQPYLRNVLRGHEGPLSSAMFSPDGARIVTASEDGTARVWDAVTGEVLATLMYTDTVLSAAFSPDGARIVTASADGAVRVWPADGGPPLAELRGNPGEVSSAAFSPDGARIVTAGADGTVRVWPADGGLPLAELRGNPGEVLGAASSPDGARIVTAGADGTVRVWPADGGPPLAELRGHTDRVYSAAFSPDGARIVTASADTTARVWNATTGEWLAVLVHAVQVYSAAFSPDGTRIVTASEDGAARIWQMHGPLTSRHYTDQALSAAFSPDGARLFIVSGDDTAAIWEVATGQPPVKLQDSGSVYSAAFSPDGTRIVTIGIDGTARLWDAATGTQPEEFDIRITGAAFSPDGARIVTASEDGTVRVWPAGGGPPVAELRGHTGPVLSAAFSPDGTHIVTAGADRTVRVWDAAVGEEPATLAYTDQVSSAVFSPDGAHIVTAGADGTVRVWRVTGGQPLVELRGHTDRVLGLAFSPDGTRIVTASADGTARVWEMETGQLLAVFEHADRVLDAVFSPDGTRIVAASADGRVQEHACDGCGSLDELITLADRRDMRELTKEEREQYDIPQSQYRGGASPGLPVVRRGGPR